MSFIFKGISKETDRLKRMKITVIAKELEIFILK